MAEAHIKAFSDIPQVELAGIYSRSYEKSISLSQKYKITNAYESISEMYEHTYADLVVIAVSELSTYSVCCQAFQFPWKLLVEKPVGCDLQEALDLVNLSLRYNSGAYVGLNRRHYSSTRAVLDEVSLSDEPRLVQVFDQENPLVALHNGTPSKVVENFMFANSIHIVDYLKIFCRGDVLKVNHLIRWSPSNPRFVLATIEYSSGDIGLYQATWNGPGPWAVSVTTQSKRWEMRPLEQAFTQVYQSRKSEPLPVHNWDLQFKPGLRQQALEVINLLSGKSHSLPTIVESFDTMKLISQIYEA